MLNRLNETKKNYRLYRNMSYLKNSNSIQKITQSCPTQLETQLTYKIWAIFL